MNNLNLASFSQNFVLVHTAEQPYSLLINIINLVIFQICYFFLHLIKLFQQLTYIHFSIWPYTTRPLFHILLRTHLLKYLALEWFLRTYRVRILCASCLSGPRPTRGRPPISSRPSRMQHCRWSYRDNTHCSKGSQSNDSLFQIYYYCKYTHGSQIIITYCALVVYTRNTYLTGKAPILVAGFFGVQSFYVYNNYRSFCLPVYSHQKLVDRNLLPFTWCIFSLFVSEGPV